VNEKSYVPERRAIEKVGPVLHRELARTRRTARRSSRCLTADEIFTSGNYSKILPVTRLDDRHLQEGPVAKKALEAYLDWAHGNGSDF
jgi:branched-chain amino acid aminotransferase